VRAIEGTSSSPRVTTARARTNVAADDSNRIRIARRRPCASNPDPTRATTVTARIT